MPDAYETALAADLRQHGVTAYRVEMGGKHRRMVFTWRGRTERVVFPASPSDSRRGVLNALQSLRNLMGVKRVIAPRSDRPAKARAPRPDTLTLADDAFAPRPDPWERLVALGGDDA